MTDDADRTECRAVRLTIEPHDNADALELAVVGGYRAVVKKGQFQSGELAVYVPEGSVVPPYLQTRLGLEGRLAGPAGDRVRAVRLRGQLSQGLVVPLEGGRLENGAGEAVDAVVGHDYAAFLDVTKHVPAVPDSMAGAVWAAGLDRTLAYDVDNVKRWPDVLQDGEPVVMTEKVHGTFLGCGWLPASMGHPEQGRVVVFSKGLGAKGLAFEADTDNVYTWAVRDSGLAAALERVYGSDLEEPVFALGEVFGAGVQDLGYGVRDGPRGLRLFDVFRGRRSAGAYLDDADLEDACAALGVGRVPVLYRGPYSEVALAEHTSGRETVSGAGAHVREGVVVRSAVERRDPELGRVQLKSVSDDYLTRKGGTEYV